MKKKEKWIVGNEGLRPAVGFSDRCMYCKQPIGAEHGPECVVPQRTVKIRLIAEFVISVPDSWTPADILFHQNESSNCRDNLLTQMQEFSARDLCLCNYGHVEFVGEATEEDEEFFGIQVEKIPE